MVLKIYSRQNSFKNFIRVKMVLKFICFKIVLHIIFILIASKKFYLYLNAFKNFICI